MFGLIKRRNIGNIILIYHSSFSDKNILRDQYIHNVTPENIINQIEILSKFYDLVNLDDLFCFDSKIDGKMAITFDDGYSNLFKDILPELIQKKIHSTVFLIGNTFHGNILWREKIAYLLKNPKIFNEFKYFYSKNVSFNWDYNTFYRESKSFKFNSKELDNYLDQFLSDYSYDITTNLVSEKENLIKNDYVSYGNHTYNHYVLSSLTEEEQYYEIFNNVQLLSDLDVNLSNVFAFPFGGLNDYNKSTLKILNDLNIKNVLLSNNVMNFYGAGNINNVKYLDRFSPSNNKYYFIYRILKNIII
tara:strand:+ start:1816 stop:2724 length:909 start_codon:yes stop_codon:yes gene_type:complete